MDRGLCLFRSLKQPSVIIVDIGLLVQDGLPSVHGVGWAKEKKREKNKQNGVMCLLS